MEYSISPANSSGAAGSLPLFIDLSRSPGVSRYSPGIAVHLSTLETIYNSGTVIRFPKRILLLYYYEIIRTAESS